MKRIINYLCVWLGLMAVLFILFYGYTYYNVFKSKNLYEKIKNKNKVYVYDTVECVLNPAMYISDLSDTSNFIQYYNKLYDYYKKIDNGLIKREWKIFNGDTIGYIEPVSINFPIKYMSYSGPVYFIRYIDKDSLIAEVIDFKTECWGYLRGYVYCKNIHNNHPSENKLKVISYNYQKNNLKKKIKDDDIYEKISEYGIQCWGCK